MYLLYKKQTGELKMYSDMKPIYDKDKLECTKLTVSKGDMDKIKTKKYHLKIEDKKLKIWQ